MYRSQRLLIALAGAGSDWERPSVGLSTHLVGGTARAGAQVTALHLSGHGAHGARRTAC